MDNGHDHEFVVLDIDLDFFLSEITSSGAGERQDDRVKPWSVSKVQEFLELQCCLSRSDPRPGSIVTTHDEAFCHWKALIGSRRLPAPFHVVHVDAHADLGLSLPTSSTDFICTELLAHPVEKRSEVRFESFDECSYLVFAVACGWVSQLDYVHHPKLNLALGDVPQVHLEGFEQNASALQLKLYKTDDLRADPLRDYKTATPIACEPPVPFFRVSGNVYQSDRRPDYIFVAQSPAYTPQSADSLLDLIREYIIPI